MLFGKASPSGRLPVTFYQDVEDLPAFTDYSMQNRTYRYFTGEALYPFGYGLSYTTFAYGKADYAGETLSVEVTNTGAMAGDEVVQVYVKNHHPLAPLNPVLCGFQRVQLNPGETKRVNVALNPRSFTLVDELGQSQIHEGRSTLFISGYQPDKRSLALTGSAVLTIEVGKE